jgi:hypothetical protein
VLAIAIICVRPSSSSADLGPAEAEMKTTSFQAWCGKRKNNCTVSFEEDRLVVNNKDGISRSQILRIWSDKEMRDFRDRNPMSYYQDVYYVTYKKSDGSDGTGRFIFLNHQVSAQFWNQLQVFLGPGRREVGPSIKVEN